MFLLACVSFFSVAALGRATLPPTDSLEAHAKLEHLRQNPAKYDVIYVGSSTVLRHFAPVYFDAETRNLGLPTRSFNLGAAGMVGFEADYILTELLAIDGLNARFIFMELSDFGTGFAKGMEGTERGVEWHTLAETAKVLRLIIEEDKLPLQARWKAFRSHLAAASWRLSNYGQGERILSGLTGDDQAHIVTSQSPWIANRGGYLSLEESKRPWVAQRRKDLLKNPESLMDAVENLRKATKAGPIVETGGAWLYTDQMDRIRAHGAEPLAVVPVSLKPSNAIWALANEPNFPTILSYNDPIRFPQFFTLKSRFDRDHLTRKAAIKFTSLLAKNFVSLYRTQ